MTGLVTTIFSRLGFPNVFADMTLAVQLSWSKLVSEQDTLDEGGLLTCLTVLESVTIQFPLYVLSRLTVICLAMLAFLAVVPGNILLVRPVWLHTT
jgi:hypothetical protein